MLILQKGLGFWQWLVLVSGGWPDPGEWTVNMGGRVVRKQNESFMMLKKIYINKKLEQSMLLKTVSVASCVILFSIFTLLYLNWKVFWSQTNWEMLRLFWTVINEWWSSQQCLIWSSISEPARKQTHHWVPASLDT